MGELNVLLLLLLLLLSGVEQVCWEQGACLAVYIEHA